LKSLIDGYTHDGKVCEVYMLAKHQTEDHRGTGTEHDYTVRNGALG